MAHLLLALAALGVGAWAAPTQGSVDLPEKALARRISVDFDAVPLAEAVAFLRATLNINIVLDQTAPEVEERLITLRLQDVTGRQAVRAVTRAAGLDFAISENVLYIGAPARMATVGRPYFRQYDVHDLLASARSGLRGFGENRYAAAGRRGAYDRNDEGGDNALPGSAAEQELMALILIFTGGPQNWDVFTVMGGDSNLERESTEDAF